MTGHTPPPSLRAAIARLDRDTLRAVAIAYRMRRQEGAADGPAYEAAVAELQGRAPNLTDQAAREAVSLIIARAAIKAQQWFWRGTCHGQRDRQAGRMAKALTAPPTGLGLRRTTLVDAVVVWLGGKAAASKSERYELLYALPWAEVTTNNYGFAPAPGDHPERFQLQMYAELHKRLLAAGGSTGARLLEISCGRGGGLRHLVALRDDDLFAVGFDLSSHAIRFCHAHHGRPGRLAFVRGDALRLPFDDGSFDVVVNVEASHAYGDDAALLAEVRRVLTPGGAFLYADSRRAAKLGCLEQQVREAGFTGELADITEHVSLACELDRERRQALIRRGVPWYWRILLGRRLAQYAALPGSPKFEAFRTRERVYFMGCLAAPPDPARRRCARWRRSARRERRCASPGGAA